MLLPAPVLFSITNCWPSFSDSRWPIKRAIISVAPPGGYPTTKRTGRVGYSSAEADPIDAIAEIPIANRQIAVRREAMQFLPDGRLRRASVLVELTKGGVVTNKA